MIGQILVIGEQKQNPDEDRSTKTLVQLAGYAHEVFEGQTEPRFLALLVPEQRLAVHKRLMNKITMSQHQKGKGGLGDSARVV